MDRSLRHCQFIAFGMGLLLCFGLLFGVFLIDPLVRAITLNDSSLGVPCLLVMVAVVNALFAVFMAFYARRHDLVAFITCAVPCFVFLALLTYLTMLERSNFGLGGCFSFPDPFEPSYWRGAFIFLGISFAAAAIGIAIKRIAVGKSSEPSAPITRESSRSFSIFITIVAIALLSLMGYSKYKISPAHQFAEARKQLASPGTSMEQRLRILRYLRFNRSSEASSLLTLALATQPHPANVVAAGYLAERNDLSGLPLLDKELMQLKDEKPASWVILVCDSLRRIRNPNAAPTMQKLTTCPNTLVRETATSTLNWLR